MKTYKGEISGYETTVTVNGKPLPLRLDLLSLSPEGFAWGYKGNGPAQLALAILADHLDDDDQALGLYQPFMEAVIVGLAGAHAWILTTLEIIQALDDLELDR